jgi:hypothetical protein
MLTGVNVVFLPQACPQASKPRDSAPLNDVRELQPTITGLNRVEPLLTREILRLTGFSGSADHRGCKADRAGRKANLIEGLRHAASVLGTLRGLM